MVVTVFLNRDDSEWRKNCNKGPEISSSPKHLPYRVFQLILLYTILGVKNTYAELNHINGRQFIHYLQSQPHYNTKTTYSHTI